MKSNKKIALVVPTIRILNSWRSYVENFKKYGHDLENIKLIVVDDYCPYIKENIALLDKCNAPYEFWTIDMQKQFFRKHFGAGWQKYWEVIPHRTDACRSFGYLIAALWGAEIIVTWDDDNWAINSPKSGIYDYIGKHTIVNERLTAPEASSSTKWLNTCHFLKKSPNRELYPRGYPFSKQNEVYSFKQNKGKVVMNVGLWIGNPDVDAITVLNEGSMNGLPVTRTTGFSGEKLIFIAKDTFAPLNTANTAYSRDILPCIYDTFQGAQVSELKLDRYGDIWCNFFIKKIVDAVGDKIALGVPLVDHQREPRNTMVDFMKEFWGVVVSQRIFEEVASIKLRSNNYFDAYAELTEHLYGKSDKIYPGNKAIAKYFRKLFKSMNGWLEILEKLELR